MVIYIGRVKIAYSISEHSGGYISSSKFSLFRNCVTMTYNINNKLMDIFDFIIGR